MKHYKAWEMAGKTKYGKIAEAKVRAHSNYKKAIHKTKTESEKGISTKLQNKLLKANKKKFWRSWQSCFKNKIHNNNLTVGGLSNNIDIANYLASNFKQTCTPNSNFHQNKFKEIYLKNKLNQPADMKDNLIDTGLIRQAINCIQDNKAAGHDGLQ